MTIEPLERGGYLIQRSVMDDPVFPAFVSVMVLTIERDGPDVAQRFTGHLSDDGTCITGAWEIDEDGTGLVHDLDVIYTKTA